MFPLSFFLIPLDLYTYHFIFIVGHFKISYQLVHEPLVGAYVKHLKCYRGKPGTCNFCLITEGIA